MNDNVYTPHRYFREGLLSAISVGVFFVLVGMIFVTRPGLYTGLQNFLNTNNWTNTNRTIGNTNVTIPVPLDPRAQNPGASTEVYNAVLEFCLAWGFFQILILAFRFIVPSPRRRTARTISSIVFWFGAAYLINTYLNATTTITDITQRQNFFENNWFIFWAAMIVLIGIILIVRAIALAVLRKR